MSDEPVAGAASTCPACGVELAASLLSCPQCQRLVHAEELKQLAARAERATGEHDCTGALQSWRRALELLPPTSRQYLVIAEKIETLSRQVDPAQVVATGSDGRAPDDKARAEGTGSWGKRAAGLGAVGLLVWKFKFVAAFLLTKGKLLLLGLTKATTFFSMLAALGVYWAAWGWKFALGLVLSIYIHEMGHVAALRRFGIKASAPMFIPGFGALVRLKQMPANRREDARIGLAGPIWGLGGALATYAMGLAFGWASWQAIARVAAWINLFNLLPVWQLDGSRGFQALTRGQRWLAAATLAAMWYLTAEGLLLLILIAACVRALAGQAADKPDRVALVQYVGLVVVLAALSAVEVALPQG